MVLLAAAEILAQNGPFRRKLMSDWKAHQDLYRWHPVGKTVSAVRMVER